MESAFDAVDAATAEYIRKSFLAGAAMSDIREGFRGVDGKFSITLRAMRAMRDEVFDPLISDPAKVASLANGPVLNPLEIVRYRRRSGRKPRMARPGAKQIEMFGA